METKINKRTSADIHRSFSNHCVSCSKSKLINIERNPKIARCSEFNQVVNLFHDTCQFYDKTKHLKPLKFKHVDYLINETQLLK